MGGIRGIRGGKRGRWAGFSGGLWGKKWGGRAGWIGQAG